MTSFKFSRKRLELAPTCPCGRSNKDGKFAPLEENPKAGKCHSCGLFFSDGLDINNSILEIKPVPSFFNANQAAHYISNYKQSVFAKWLHRIGGENAYDILERYQAGCYPKHKNAIIFWQIDVNQHIRSGKIMGYNSNGKRKKKPTSISWMHTELKIEGFVLAQCWFGEHLLADWKGKHVCIVESEKTALVASLHYPKALWLATGGKTNFKLRTELKKALQPFQVVVYPDAGAYEQWQPLAEDYGFRIDYEIEQMFREGRVQEGYDLADYCLECKQ